MDDFTELPNIGEELNRQIHHAGIHDVKTLKRLGAQKVWLKIKAFDESACIHRLYAIEGAIQEKKKGELDETAKKELKAFYQKNK